MFQVQRIDHVAFVVRDMDAMVEWYKRVFGMERAYEEEWSRRRDPVALCAGEACVALFRLLEGEQPPSGEPKHPNEHFALSVDRANFDKAQEHLRSLGIEFKVWNHKVCDSLYIFDPEGNQIEITTYEM